MVMRQRLRAVGLGFLGVLLGLAVWHLWLDHRNLHALLQFATQPRAAQGVAK